MLQLSGDGTSEAYCPRLSKPYPLSLSKVTSINCDVNSTSHGVRDDKDHVNKLNVHPEGVCESSAPGGSESSDEPLEQDVDDDSMCAEHDLRRVWEVAQGESQVVDVQGRLHKCIAFWEHELKATPPVIECIRIGYKLPLLAIPGVYYKSNAKSTIGDDSLYHLPSWNCMKTVAFVSWRIDCMYTVRYQWLIVARVKRD